MKTIHIVLIVIGLFIIGFLVWPKNNVNLETSSTGTEVPAPSSPTESASSIKGCYVTTNGSDIYTLDILMQDNTRASGLLSFKNSQKDSSSGTFSGTYSGGVLIGDYSFKSEGTTSVMQVAFKKQGEDFVRGYGDMNADGTRFADPTKVTYDASMVLSVFKLKGGDCK